jgi:hypothetical protein
LEMLGSWECKQTSSCRMSNSSTVWWCFVRSNKASAPCFPVEAYVISCWVHGIHASSKSRNADYWSAASTWNRSHLLRRVRGVSIGFKKLWHYHGPASSHWHGRSFCPGWLALFQFLVCYLLWAQIASPICLKRGDTPETFSITHISC